jgi:hypothetical protein
MGGCGETLEDLKTRILTCTHLGIVYIEWINRKYQDLSRSETREPTDAAARRSHGQWHLA